MILPRVKSAQDRGPTLDPMRGVVRVEETRTVSLESQMRWRRMPLKVASSRMASSAASCRSPLTKMDALTGPPHSSAWWRRTGQRSGVRCEAKVTAVLGDETTLPCTQRRCTSRSAWEEAGRMESTRRVERRRTTFI